MRQPWRQSTVADGVLAGTNTPIHPHAAAFVDWLRLEAQREEAFARTFLVGKRVIEE